MNKPNNFQAEGTETTAISDTEMNSKYKLFGYKWFSSATDSDMTITLAKVCDENKKVFDSHIVIIMV